MEDSRFNLIIIFFTITYMVMIPIKTAGAKEIFKDDFESGLSKWSFVGSDVTIKSGSGYGGGNAVCVKYYKGGSGDNGSYSLTKNISADNMDEIYVEFDFKIENVPTGGSKFLKLFGVPESPAGYANTTFALQYAGNVLYEVSYGSEGTIRDSQAVIRYDGTYWGGAPNIPISTSTIDPKDGKWHAFAAYIKCNDDGQNNGIYKVWYDGNLVLHAENINNRNDNNSHFFSYISLGDYNGGGTTFPAWYLYYDNFVITTTPPPVVNTVTPGQISNNDVVTISGSNLMSQDDSNWVIISESQGSFEDTQGWQPYASYWTRDGWIVWDVDKPDNNHEVVWDSKVSLIGNQSYRGHLHLDESNWYDCDPGGGKICVESPWVETHPSLFANNEAYYRMYIRYSNNFKWPNNYWKLAYHSDLDTIDPLPASCVDDKGPVKYGFGHGRLYGDLGRYTKIEKWYCIEWYWKIINRSIPQMAVKLWVDGVKIIDEDNYTGSYPAPKFASLRIGTVNCSQFSLADSPVNQYTWIDGFAMSASSRIYPAAIVEIGDSPDYATATKVKQELLHIADVAVEFKADLTGLSDLSYYLWVTNNRQERSAAYLLGASSVLHVDVNADGNLDILDIQACINVIIGTETNPAVILRAKQVTEPLDGCNVLDVQEIVNIILEE